MTVSELISKLMEMPEDAEVVHPAFIMSGSITSVNLLDPDEVEVS